MSQNSWKFKSKKDVRTNAGTKCKDCKNPIYPGSFARRFVYQNGEKKEFKALHICEDCEKYWRNKEPRP